MPDLLEADVLAERIVEAREDEARRIARMIHDHVGQLASAACLAVVELERDLPEHRRPALDRLAHCVTALEEGLRGLAREIHAVGVDDRGLLHALSCLVEGFRARLGIRFDVALTACDGIQGRRAIAAYRVVQEALTNIARHARATRVRVAAEREGDHLRILVADDGVGLRGHAPGLGLAAIRERLAALGGSLDLRSPPEGGTELRADLPWRPPSTATC